MKKIFTLIIAGLFVLSGKSYAQYATCAGSIPYSAIGTTTGVGATQIGAGVAGTTMVISLSFNSLSTSKCSGIDESIVALTNAGGAVAVWTASTTVGTTYTYTTTDGFARLYKRCAQAGSDATVSWYTIDACGNNVCNGSAPTLVQMSNAPISTCSATFTDPAGCTVNYSNSQDFTQTFCPATLNSCINVNFTAFALSADLLDYLKVYDGNSIAAPLIGTYTGNTSPGFVSPSNTNATGCLTFVFHSSAANVAAGWRANVTCGICPVICPASPCPSGTHCVGSSCVPDCDIAGATVPANDAIGSSESITNCGVSFYTCNYNATPGPCVGDPQGGGFNNDLDCNAATGNGNGGDVTFSVENDIWYKFCPLATGAWTLNIVPSQCNTTSGYQYSIFYGTPTNLTQLVAGGTNGLNLTSAASINFNVTQTALCYFLQIDGYGGTECVFAVNVGPTAAGAGCSLAAAGATICEGTTASLTASGSGGTFNWYAAAVGGASLFTGNPYVTPTLTATTNYYVSETIAGVESARTIVTVTVNPSATITLTSAAATTSQTKCINTAITNITYTVAGGGTGAGVTGLPAGVTGSFAGGVFTISGTPTASGTFNYTVTTTGTCTQVTALGTITVNPNATITLTSAAATTSQTLCVSTAITNITYTVAGGGTGAGVTGLPAGVTGAFSGGTFTISGTPTATGTFNYTVTTTGTCTQVTASGTIIVNPNATITLTSAAATTSQSLCVSIAIANITYTVAGGGTGAGVTGLPAGVTGSFAGGIFTISGTPTATGTFNYTVTTTGTCTQTNAIGSITVNPNAVITLTSAAATTSQTLCLTSPLTTITYSVTGGGTGAGVTGLPAGLTGSYAAGVFTISGTPTATGTFNYTVTTTGTCTQATALGSIIINPNAAISLTSAVGTNAQTVCISTAITSITYSITGGGTGAGVTGLPAGVTGSFAGGVFTITGTPTASGTFNYTVTTTGTCTQTTALGSITVNPNAAISLTSAVGTNAQTLCLTNPIAAITYSITGGGTGAGVTGLPAGVSGSFAGGVYTISGTPTATGTFNYTITTTGTCTQTTALGTITINPNAAIVLTSAAATTAQTLCINAAITSISYSVTGGGTGAGVAGLPAGVTGSFAGGVFTITGIPTASGTFNYTVTTTGTCTQANASGSIIVNPLPAITSVTPTDESVCGADDGTITIIATGTGLTYSINGGTSFVGTNIFSGLAAAGYTVIVKNDAGCTINGGVISISSAGAPAMPTANAVLNPLCAGSTLTLSVDSPVVGETYSWSGPGGYAASDTVVSILNVTTAMTGIYTVTANIGSCVSPGGSINITVNPNAAITLASAALTDAQTLCLTNPITTITYSITGGGTGAGIIGLPAGLTGSFAAGVFTISGTPTATGTFNYTVTTTGTCAQANASGSITINPNAAIALISALNTDAQTVCLTNGITPITYSVTGGGTGAGITGLPAGLIGSYAAGVFTISGIPTVTGTFNYTVTTTGTCAQTNVIGSITINPNAGITITSAVGTDAQTLCLTNPITTITYSISGGGTGAGITGLPAGLTGSFAGGIFTISGTPTATGTFNYTVTTTGTCAQTNAVGSITIDPNAAIAITSAVGTDAQTVCLNSAITSITYSITGGGTSAGVTGLPAGLSGSYALGVFTISGTPTATGTFNYTVTTTGTCTQTNAIGSITINPNAAITITSALGTDAQTLCLTDPITTITYSITGGGTGAGITGLSAGLTGSFAGGVFTISGIPNETGTFNYSVNTTGTCTQANAAGSIIINSNAAIALTSGVGTDAQTVCISTAVNPVTYSVTGGGTGAGVTGLPAGMTSSFAAGVFTISGTPTATGTFNYNITTTGTCTQTTATGSITVNPDATITLTSAVGTDAQTLCIDSTIITITYLIEGGGTGAGITGLPAGLTGSFAGDVFTIFGAPSASGTFNYSVTTTGTCAQAIATGSILVNPDAAIVLTSAAGTDSQSPCLNSAIGSITYSVSGGGTGAGVVGLPPGVTGSFSGGVFTISGSPTSVGIFNYAITTTGTCMQVTAFGTITVNPNATIALSSAAGTNAQTICINAAITNITYAIGGGGTGAGVTGLPAGITGSFAGGVYTISGTTTASGTFNYTVTTTGNCSQTTAIGSIIINALPLIDTTSMVITPASCGISDGTITGITASGATALSYTWNGAVSASIDINNIPVGAYTLMATDLNSCSSSMGPVFVINPGAPAAPLATNPADYCQGDLIADLTATGTGGTLTWYSDAGLTTLIGTGSPFISGATASTTFYVTETILGCESSPTSVTITINTTPAAPGAPSPAPYCQGDLIADLEATPSSGGTITWYSDAGLTTQLATGSVFVSGATNTTTYYVTETLIGCSSQATVVTITIDSVPVVTSIPFTDETACGVADGTITINATGTGLSYSIDGGVIFVPSNTFTGLDIGNYPILVTNSSGCIADGGIVSISFIGDPLMPTAVASPNPICLDSTLTLSVASPLGSEIYTWYGPGAYLATGTSVIIPNITATMAGTYTVTATNGNCVSPDGLITINVNPNDSIALTSAVGTDIQTVCLAGSINNITYSITGGGTGAGVTGLPAGITGSYAGGVFTISGTSTATGTFNYTVTTTGACVQATSTGSITINSYPNFTVTELNPSACGASDGSITLSGLTANTAYNITYTTGAIIIGPASITSNVTGEIIISGLSSGAYSSIIATLSGCSFTQAGPYSLNDPGSPSFSVASTNPTTCSGIDGTLTLSGLTASTSYAITYTTGTTVVGPTAMMSTASGNIIINGLSASTYSTIVVSLAGCSSTDALSYILVDPNAPTFTVTTANPTTCGGVDGTISLSGLTASTSYSVTYTNGATVVGPTAMTSNGSGTILINGLTQGAYSTIGVALAGCNTIDAGPYNLNDPASPTFTVATGNPTTCAGLDGTLTLSGLTASTSYTATYANGATVVGPAVISSDAFGNIVISGLSQGIYSNVTVSLAGCSTAVSGPYNLNDPGSPTFTVAPGSPTSCAGSNGTLTLSGLTTNTSYAVTYLNGATVVGPVAMPSNASGIVVINGLTQGIYSNVTVSLAGCSTTVAGPYNLNDPGSPTFTVASGNPTTCSGTDGTITLSGLTASTSYSVTYTNGVTVVGPAAITSGVSGNIVIPGLTQGTYSNVTVTFAGCSTIKAGPFGLADPIAPVFTVASTNSPTTCGGTDGKITLSGLTPGISYTVTYSNGTTVVGPAAMTSNGSGNIVITGLSQGSYSTILVSLAGCSTPDAGPFNLNDPNAPAAPIPGPDFQICEGAQLSLTSNTVPNATYSWFGPNGFASSTEDPNVSNNATVLMSGTYSVTVTVAGCTSLPGQTSVIVNPNPIVDLGPDETIIAGSSAILTTSAVGAYLWSTGDTTNSIIVSPAITTEYCVTVTTPATCSDNDCVTITVEKPCGKLFIPTAFSPNGDNENDVLKVYNGNSACISYLELVIFDRWGEKVFETTDPAIGWDGVFHGKKLDPAVFVYYLKAVLDGKDISKHGNITLTK